MTGVMVGFIARGVVMAMHLPAGGLLILLALPSAVIGALVGGIAGATAKPIKGAIVGAVLSGVIYEVFVLAISGLFGKAEEGVAYTFFYALQMALAGGIAGALGGLVGSQEMQSRYDADGDGQPARRGLEKDFQQVAGSNCVQCGDRISSSMDAGCCPGCKKPLHYRCGMAAEESASAYLCAGCRGTAR